MEFKGIREAVTWLKLNGHPKASSSSICSCCSGSITIAYMLRWSYSLDDIESKINMKNTHRGKVKCSNGMIFNVMKDAVNWLKESGFKSAAHSKISAVCKGKRATAYKLTWEYIYD